MSHEQDSAIASDAFDIAQAHIFFSITLSLYDKPHSSQAYFCCFSIVYFHSKSIYIRVLDNPR